MKTNKILMIGLSSAMFISCGKSAEELQKEKEVRANDSIAKVQDSIRIAEEKEIEVYKKDSIEASKIEKYLVKMIEGKHKYGGKTTFKYMSLPMEIDFVRAQASKEMWTDEKLDHYISLYKNTAKGGTITLNVERGTIDAANSEMFSIIVKDSNEKELYRKEFDSEIPDHSSSVWYNYFSTILPEKIETPFYVYVIDRLQDTPFKFEVTPVMK